MVYNEPSFELSGELKMFSHVTYYCPKCKFGTTRSKCSSCGGPVSYEKPPQEEIDLAQYKQLLSDTVLQCVHREKFNKLKAQFGDL